MDETTLNEPAAVPAPLGPGDDDPRSPATPARETPKPLGPGDDDPRSPATPAGATPQPLGPGENDGENPDDAFEFLAPAPPGPGDPDRGPRHLVRVPKRT